MRQQQSWTNAHLKRWGRGFSKNTGMSHLCVCPQAQEGRANSAECIGALPEEIHFTSGGTESDHWIIKSSALADTEKRATLVSAFEHHAILRPSAAIGRLGYPVAYIWPPDEGYITPGTSENSISNSTRLVSIMFTNNEIGSIQPIQKLCQKAHSQGALSHTDAVQAVGHIEINVHDLGVDFLTGLCAQA